MNIHIYIYTHIHIYTHTDTRTHIHLKAAEHLDAKTLVESRLGTPSFAPVDAPNRIHPTRSSQRNAAFLTERDLKGWEPQKAWRKKKAIVNAINFSLLIRGDREVDQHVKRISERAS